MRVVLFKQELQAKGGLEKATLRIADAFVKKGCDVSIVTATDVPACPSIADITTVSFPLRGTLPHSYLKNWDQICRNYIAKEPADIVLSFDRTTLQTHMRAGNGVHAAYLAQRSSQSSLLKKTSFFLNPLHRTLLRLEKEAFASPNLRRIIVNSTMVRDEAIDHYGVDPRLLHVIHNGVEWSELSSHFQQWPSLREDAASEIGSDPAAFHFLFAGHEYGRKGLEALLYGLSLLPEKDHIHLLVIGRDKNISSYRRLAQWLGLPHVHFLGPRKDLYRFYALADACVVPSLYDPFANVTVEALAMGLFVVTSKHNGGCEVLDETRGAVIDDLSAPEAVAQSLRLALQHPKTEESARQIRYSIRHLDYPLHLERFTTACL